MPHLGLLGPRPVEPGRCLALQVAVFRSSNGACVKCCVRNSDFLQWGSGRECLQQ